MKVAINIVRIVSRHTWWWTVSMLVLLAFLLSLARLFLPMLEDYKEELQMQISQVVGQPVVVQEFGVGWYGMGPRLYLYKVDLLDRAGEKSLIGFERAYVDIAVPTSLLRGQVALRSLTLDGVELSLVRHEDGRFGLQGMAAKEPSAGEDGAGAVEWLLSQDNLALENSTVHWLDLTRRSESLALRNVSLYLSNHDGDHHLNGNIQLPSALGSGLSFIVDAQGLLNEAPLQIDFYLKAQGVQMAPWLAERAPAGVKVAGGRLNAELWGQWQAKRLRQVQGDFLIEGLDLMQAETLADAEPRQEKLDVLTAAFDWQGGADGWQLEMDRVVMVRNRVAWAPARMHLSRSRAAEQDEWVLATDFARIQDLLALATLSPKLEPKFVEMIDQGRPRGRIRNAYFKVAQQDYFARLELEDLALDHWDGKPGFAGLDFGLNLDRQGGVASLKSRKARLDLRPLFREMWPVKQLDGELAWLHSDEGLLFELRNLAFGNDDVGLVAGGQLFVPEEGGTPVIDLLAGIERGEVAAAHRYLPTKIMKEPLVEWLDRGLVSGQLAGGGLVLQGPLTKRMFRGEEARFEVRTAVRNGIVDYVDGWPRGEELEASLAFVSDGMNIVIVDGKILDTELQQVALEIPSFFDKPPTLTLFGNAKGSSGDLIDYINQTPLQEMFGNVTTGGSSAGESALQLALEIPFGGDHKIRTRGVVALEDTTIDLKALGIDMAELDGALEFGDKGLYAQGLLAKVMGQAALINIDSEASKAGYMEIKLRAEGHTDLPELAKRIDLPVFEFLEGDADWQGLLTIPAGSQARGVAPSLRVESNMRGISVLYPEPLAKGANEARFFELRASFGKQLANWYFDYNNETLSGVFNVPSDGRKLSGELRLGEAANPPLEAGIRIAGQLDYFDFELWRPVLINEKSEAPSGDSDTVRWLDLQIDSATMYGQTVHGLTLIGERGDRAWRAQLDSQELAGEILLPDDWSRVMLADLERLYLTVDETGGDGEGQDSIDPADLPPVVINSQDTRYGELDLGKMQLITVKKVNGLAIETFKADSKVLKADAKGVWMLPDSGIHTSSIQVEADVKDLGVLLAGLGYAKTIKFGRGKGEIHLKWNGPIYDPDAASLTGHAQGNFRDGRVLDVEPGAGRLFGIFSITALPRRLLLDFSDLFSKGFSFDSLKGRFDISGGNATTERFIMNGPAANMEVTGRVGLVAEDYDQKVRVVPNVTSGLPTLAGAGVLTGGAGLAPAAIMLLLEKLIRPGVDKITEIHYTITGSWDDPVIEAVDAKAE